MIREARLRPEHAAAVPAGRPVGEWIPAATAAAYVLAHREIVLGHAAALARRVLDDDQWESRGGEPARPTPRRSRRRIGDLALPDATPLLFPRRPISNRPR